MASTPNKFVRFKDWLSPPISPDRLRSSLALVSTKFHRKLNNDSDITTFTTSSVRTCLAKNNSKNKILDPQDPYLQKWNKAFALCCVLAVSLDPLFFYIPMIDRVRNCLDLDKRLAIIVCVLRTFMDMIYIIHIFFQFRTGFIAPSSRVFGRGELVEDKKLIKKRYLSSYFAIDILSILPVPQMIILFMAPKVTNSMVAMVTKESLKHAVFIQYVPRFARVVPLFKEVTRTSGIYAERAWIGAAYNLLVYLLASHVVGAFWYLFAIERKDRCWRKVYENLNLDYNDSFCDENETINVCKTLKDFCSIGKMDDNPNPNSFQFGIFFDALHSDVVETNDFPKKFFLCFWWGLRNLSSLGQNLKTSTYIGEILFAIFIAVLGLLLFALLISNMQKYLQSTTVRIEEMRLKRQDAEQWMSHRMLPDPLRKRIRRYEQYQWQQTRGVDEDRLIRGLPKDLRRDIKRHLCLSLLTKIPMFEKMDDRLLDAMCDRLKPVLYTENSYILREGDPVDEMLFIMRGNSETMTTNGFRTGFFNSGHLRAGDFCGEELLTWALDLNSSPNLPFSTRTVQAITAVEAFALKAEDLKAVASQFRRFHNKQLKHTFKFYSLHWRTWAAFFIQAAWRRYTKYKHEQALQKAEDARQNGTSTSLGATIYAAKFAANVKRALRHTRIPPNPKMVLLLPMLPPKPVEPNFTCKDDL